MRLILIATVLFAQAAFARLDLCEPTLVHRQDVPSSDREEAVITGFLRKEGHRLNATMVGIFEARLTNGETLVSKLYWSTEDLGRPLEGKLQEFLKVLGSRKKRTVSLRSWLLAPKSDGYVIEKIVVP